MNVLFQCLGITGVIMMSYALLAFAVTRAQAGFFWTLFALGAAAVVLFVVTSVSRAWQSTLGALVALNLPWIFLTAGKEWPLWSLGVGAAVCAAGLVAVAWGQLRSALVSAALVLTTTLAVAYLERHPIGFLKQADWHGYAVLGAAFLFNGLFLYVGRRIMRSILESRSLRYGTGAVVYSLIVLAIIAVANVAGQDFYKRIDLTENKVNTLTEQSIAVVRNLKQPVKITAFVDERNPEKRGQKDLLAGYRSQSKNVEVRFADPDKDRPLAMKHGARDGDVLVEYGEQAHLTREVTEEGITQAIVKVTRTAKPMICFTKGHGELDLEGGDEEPRGLSAVKGGIENEGYQTKAVTLVSGEVPPECGMVVVAGPVQPFAKGEADALEKHLAAGGKGLWMLDPTVPDPRLAPKEFRVQETGLEEVAGKWGAELGRNFILEKHLQLFRGVQIGMTVLAQKYGDHPIATPLKGRQTVFTNVRSVTRAPGFTGTAVELIYSAPEGMSWAETDVPTLFRQQKATPDPTDLKGPVPIALALEGEAAGEASGRGGRLVVMGDSDFASNAMVRSYEFNFDLFLNTLNWLQGEEQQISIRPKRIRTSAIELTPAQANVIFYVAIVGIPMLVLIFGMDLWWIRRRRG